MAALVGYGVFFALAFGMRGLVHYRRTGTTGYVGISGRPGSAEWWGGLLFVVALLAGFAAPIVQLAGFMIPAQRLTIPLLQAAGVCLYVLGVSGTLWAQFAMGDQWRVGVDETAATSLVVSGPFQHVRNPIFTAMGAATLGLALLVPNVFALAAIIALIAALQLQVRLVEEPYLRRRHGMRYADYTARTGRFLPRLRSGGAA